MTRRASRNAFEVVRIALIDGSSSSCQGVFRTWAGVAAEDLEVVIASIDPEYEFVSGVRVSS